MNEGTITTAKSGNGTFPQEFGLHHLMHSWVQDNAQDEGTLGRLFKWLDIGCGEGEYLKQIPEYFDQYRGEVQYYGIDKDSAAVRKCWDVAYQLGLRHPEVKEADVNKVAEEFEDKKFDAVTLINVAHELHAERLPDLLWHMVDLCADDGFLYIFDIQELAWHELEPGALPFNQSSSDKVGGFLKASFGLKMERPMKFVSRGSGRRAWCVYLKKSWIHNMPSREEFDEDGRRKMIEIVREQKTATDGEIVFLGHRLNETWHKLEADPRNLPGEISNMIKETDIKFRTSWSCTQTLARTGTAG